MTFRKLNSNLLEKKFKMKFTSSQKNVKLTVNVVCFVEFAFTKMLSVVKSYFKSSTKILYFGEMLEKCYLKICN